MKIELVCRGTDSIIKIDGRAVIRTKDRKHALDIYRHVEQKKLVIAWQK